MLPGTRRYGGARYSKERKGKKKRTGPGPREDRHSDVEGPSMDPKGSHEKLDLDFFKYPTDSIPRLQFMNALEHLKFDNAKFEFFKTGFT